MILTFPHERRQKMLIRKVVKVLLRVGSWKRIKVCVAEVTAPNKCEDLSPPPSAVPCWFWKVLGVS